MIKETHFFWWQKKRVSNPKENHRGNFVFPPNPLETTKDLPVFGIPVGMTTDQRTDSGAGAYTYKYTLLED